eukprot:1104553-Pyramimonas_sp.AAC.1
MRRWRGVWPSLLNCCASHEPRGGARAQCWPVWHRASGHELDRVREVPDPRACPVATNGQCAKVLLLSSRPLSGGARPLEGARHRDRQHGAIRELDNPAIAS